MKEDALNDKLSIKAARRIVLTNRCKQNWKQPDNYVISA